MNRFTPRRGLRVLPPAGAAVLLLALYAAVPRPSPPPPAEQATLFLDHQGRILRAFLGAGEQWYLPFPFSATGATVQAGRRAPGQRPERIPEKLRDAVLAYEDRAFFIHPGFNPFSLLRAVFQNIGAGGVVSGASTITMQVARILDPKPRTLPSKLVEIFQAVKLELSHTKGEILALYLDNAPYGGNIVGITAASLRYFGRPPGELTWAQAACLAVLPRSPGTIAPHIDPAALQRRRDELLRRLHRTGLVDAATAAAALREPVPRASLPVGMHAPHLTRMLRERYHIESGVVRTTIDLPLQNAVQEVVRAHGRYLERLGIGNAAAVVVETATGKVRAYVGSRDFFDAAVQGQVDGVTAPRSTGSILKPFLYALAMDRGLLLPRTLVEDIPSTFGTFQPHNIGLTYSGMVPAEEALIRSLNVPAVRLLERYGFRDFYLFLKQAGFSTLFRPPEEYGLTLILGGAETTLEELCAAYRGLARRGRFSRLRYLEQSSEPEPRPRATPPSPSPPRPLISPGSAFLTLQMLQHLKRPGRREWWDRYAGSRRIAWKTGTSYGNRDAWAVGVTPRWTIGVWAGNFDGRGNANLTSAQCSAPLLFAILDVLPAEAGDRWFTAEPGDLKPVTTCRETGYLAGPHCPHPVTVPAPAGAPPLPVCPFHRTVEVTMDEHWEVCSLCWEEGDHKQVSRLIYPPEVAQYLRERGQPTGSPPHKPGCPGARATGRLTILYPRDGAHLFVPRELDGTLQRITARAAHRTPAQRLYWYLDSRYLGTTSGRHTMAFSLSPGDHRLEVIDQAGNRAVSLFRTGATKGAAERDADPARAVRRSSSPFPDRPTGREPALRLPPSAPSR